MARTKAATHAKFQDLHYRKVFSVVEVDKSKLKDGNDPVKENIFTARDSFQKKKAWNGTEEEKKQKKPSIRHKEQLDKIERNVLLAEEWSSWSKSKDFSVT